MQDEDLAVDDTAVDEDVDLDEQPELSAEEELDAELSQAFDKAQGEDSDEDEKPRKELSPSEDDSEDGEEYGSAFDDLPPEIKEILESAGSELEAEYSRRAEELERREQQLTPFSSAAEQWAPYLQQIGVDPATAFSTLMQTEHTLRTGTPEQKRQALAYLQQSYGLTNDDYQPDEYVDPEVQKLRQELAQIQYGQQQFLAQQQHQAQQRELAEINHEIQSFETMTTEDGTLAYPLFEFVQEEMAALIRAGQADDLAQAYEMAIWTNPDTRAELIEFQKEQEAAERTARAKSAKRRSNSQIRTRNQGAVKQTFANIDDELGAIFDRMNP